MIHTEEKVWGDEKVKKLKIIISLEASWLNYKDLMMFCFAWLIDHSMQGASTRGQNQESVKWISSGH